MQDAGRRLGRREPCGPRGTAERPREPWFQQPALDASESTRLRLTMAGEPKRWTCAAAHIRATKTTHNQEEGRSGARAPCIERLAVRLHRVPAWLALVEAAARKLGASSYVQGTHWRSSVLGGHGVRSI